MPCFEAALLGEEDAEGRDCVFSVVKQSTLILLLFYEPLCCEERH